MSDDSSGRSGFLYFLAGAGLTYAAVCWNRSREHAERKARFATGEDFQAPPPQLTMHRPPPQQLYARPMPQQPLQQQRPQFPAPPQPEQRVNNMLPQNPQVAPFSVPTPPPMQYNPPPPPTPQPHSPQVQDGSGVEGSNMGGEQF